MTANRTARLNVFARELRRGDRIRNLTAAGVTAFDLDVDAATDTVAVFPAQADLDAGADRRFDVAGGEILVVDRPVTDDHRPVHPPVAATLPARQLALIPLTADEDGAQLDVFEAAADAELELGWSVREILSDLGDAR